VAHHPKPPGFARGLGALPHSLTLTPSRQDQEGGGLLAGGGPTPRPQGTSPWGVGSKAPLTPGFAPPKGLRGRLLINFPLPLQAYIRILPGLKKKGLCWV